jgi:hypothetical protein
MTKQKYITNKDLLREIHKSKTTYCWFAQPEYANFDAIVANTEAINEELIEKIITKKKSPKGKNAVPMPDVTLEDLIFRVMTHDHIPIDPDRKRKARGTDISYAKTNFPPFKHYKYDENGDLVEVGRSHWRGSLSNGEFSVGEGKMTNSLANMFILLVERYSRRGNWRGYTYVDEMRSHALLQLSQIGLQFDESKSDNPFAFYTTSIKNCFTRVLNLERRNQNIRDELLIVAGVSPSITRQVENEMEYRFPQTTEVTVTPKKRGAPRKVVKAAAKPTTEPT